MREQKTQAAKQKDKASERLKKCLSLFGVFFKIGLFTFGGGYAMLSLIDDECVEKKKWITGDEMLDITAVAEATPGPIAINCATFTGFKQAGIPGSACSTLGVVLPSFIIIYIISMFIDRFMTLTIVANAFRGIRVAVGIMIIYAGVRMLKKMHRHPVSFFVLVAAILMILLTSFTPLNVSAIWIVLAAGITGYIAYALCGGKDKKEGAGR